MNLIIIKLNHYKKEIQFKLQNINNDFMIEPTRQDFSEIRYVSNIIDNKINVIKIHFNSFHFHNIYKNYQSSLIVRNIIINKKILFIIKAFSNHFDFIRTENISIKNIKILYKLNFYNLIILYDNDKDYYTNNKNTNFYPNKINILYGYKEIFRLYFDIKNILYLLL